MLGKRFIYHRIDFLACAAPIHGSYYGSTRGAGGPWPSRRPCGDCPRWSVSVSISTRSATRASPLSWGAAAAAVGRGAPSPSRRRHRRAVYLFMCHPRPRAAHAAALRQRGALRSDSAARCALETRRAGALSGNTIARNESERGIPASDAGVARRSPPLWWGAFRLAQRCGRGGGGGGAHGWPKNF